MVKYINWPSKESTASAWVHGDKNTDYFKTPFTCKAYEVPDDIKSFVVPDLASLKYVYRVSYAYNSRGHILDIPVDMDIHESFLKDSLVKKFVSMAVESSNPKHEESFRYYLGQEITRQLSSIKKNPYTEISMAATKLPGMGVMMEPPCDCSWLRGAKPLMENVIHLNDFHGWSREKIADWIDELHEAGTINAEFQPWDEGEGEKE